MNRPNKNHYNRCFSLNYDNTWFENPNPQYVKDLEKYIDQLEKAFDRACGELEYYDNHMFGVLPVTKEQWKEWCLKNE